MDLYLDSGLIEEFRAACATGLIDGATTNPSLIASSGRSREEVLAEVCEIVKGPVSGEVIATDADGMVKEARELRKISDHIVIKVPLIPEGLKACKTLTGEGHPVNVTLCFSANQALLAAKAGATYVSPFIGRIDDRGQDGTELIAEMRAIFDNYGFDTRILAASIRHAMHVKDVALAGADIATIPAKIFHQLFQHPLTDAGLAAFLADHAKSQKS
jgi:transaldolase